MSASVPDWLLPQPTSQLPAWLTQAPQAAPSPAALPDFLVCAPRDNKVELRAMTLKDYEMAFPRVLDRMYGGETFTEAVAELPFKTDRGAFMRWIRKDAQRYAMFKEAKEVRTEVWAGEMLKHAIGKTSSDQPIPEELDRAKFIVDTYKFLIKADNKKEYGDTKQVEITQTISVRTALDKAKTRVFQAQTEPDDDDPILPAMPLLTEAIDAEWEENED